MYELIPFTSCNFCKALGQSAGDVFIDPRVVCDLHSQGNSPGPEDPARLFRFNSPQPDPGPCPHLASFWVQVERHEVDVAGGTQVAWETDISWLSPEFDESDPDGSARSLLLHLTAGFEEEELLPEELHRVAEFELSWPDLRDSGKHEPVFVARGLVVFAERVPDFVRDLRTRMTELMEATGNHR